MEHHGSPFGERWRIVRERALAIRALWRDDPAEFHGEYVDFAPLHALPKPYQAGGPPIYIGSNSAQVPARVAEYADGWMPIYERYAGDPLTDLARACDAVGRDPASLTVLLFGAPPDLRVLEDYRRRGCDGFVFLVPPERQHDMPRALDEIAALREAFET